MRTFYLLDIHHNRPTLFRTKIRSIGHVDTSIAIIFALTAERGVRARARRRSGQA